MKSYVIIPTYNEAKSIGDIVKKIRNQNLEVLVIDDGSNDDTAKIAKENGALVIRNNKNQGKGASLVKGFDFALKNEFDAVITMDGDGQHLPEDVLKFIEITKNSKNALFIGNRMVDPATMPLVRKFTNMLLSWFISLLIGQNIPDTQCGLRLIKRELLMKLRLATMRYETESEILIQASRLGYQIESVPVSTIYLREKSQIRPLRDTFRFIKFIISEFIRI